MAITLYPPTILIEQARCLVLDTHALKDLAHAESARRGTLLRALFLMAAAAAEAILSEYACSARPALYREKRFRRLGPPGKYEALVGERWQDLEWLWDVRKAITHSEPDHVRAGRFGAHLNLEGADRACSVLRELVVRVWGDGLPAWLSAVNELPRDA